VIEVAPASFAFGRQEFTKAPGPMLAIRTRIMFAVGCRSAQNLRLENSEKTPLGYECSAGSAL